MGSYLSDLDSLLSSVKGCSRYMSLEDYLERKAKGLPVDDEFEPAFDRDMLARLVVFATDAIRDADNIKRTAEELQALALSLYHEQSPRDWGAHRARIKQWHQDALRDEA